VTVGEIIELHPRPSSLDRGLLLAGWPGLALGPGDTFGEIGLLLTAGKRVATVVAQTPMKLLALSEPDFERIQGQIPEFERSLRSLGLERSSGVAAPPRRVST
jgi:CRP-like cAMP-binding protein